MHYRRLGRTGLTVSEIGFGTIPVLQGNVPVLPEYYNLNDHEALAVMEHAFRLGCNLYDTAIGTAAQANAAMKLDIDPDTASDIGSGTDSSCPVPSFQQVMSVLEKEYSPIPCDRCQRCVCPHGTEIHTVFRQYQYYFLGKEHWALRKLKMGIEESVEMCRTCETMPCLDMCPARIRIPDEMEKVGELCRHSCTK